MTKLSRNPIRQTRRRVFHAVTLFLLVGALSAFAHARLLRSNPVDKATLEKAPERVELWFNELLDEGFNTIELFPAEQAKTKTQTNLVGAAPQVDSSDRTHLTIDLPALSPGKYIVNYRVLSRDGHTAPGRITFTVLAPK